MPNAFKNARALIQTTTTTVYTAPVSTIAIVIGCQVSNVSAASEEVSVWWTDDSNADAITRLVEDVVIPAKASLAPIAGKLVLEAGDAIYATGQTNDDAQTKQIFADAFKGQDFAEGAAAFVEKRTPEFD
jgi:hypothetical protein